MSEILDEYLNYLQEGVWGAVTKALEFPTAKHPKYKLLVKSLNDRQILCREANPAHDTRLKVQSQYGEVQFGDYQENPDYGNCLHQAYYDFAKDFLDLVKREKIQGICRYNRNLERCSRWVEEEVIKKGNQLKNLKRQLDFMKKGRKISKPNYQKFVSALYKKG